MNKRKANLKNSGSNQTSVKLTDNTIIDIVKTVLAGVCSIDDLNINPNSVRIKEEPQRISGQFVGIEMVGTRPNKEKLKIDFHLSPGKTQNAEDLFFDLTENSINSNKSEALRDFDNEYFIVLSKGDGIGLNLPIAWIQLREILTNTNIDKTYLIYIDLGNPDLQKKFNKIYTKLSEILDEVE